MGPLRSGPRWGTDELGPYKTPGMQESSRAQRGNFCFPFSLLQEFPKTTEMCQNSNYVKTICIVFKGFSRFFCCAVIIACLAGIIEK